MIRLLACAAVAMVALTGAAEAKGCIKGAIVGGVVILRKRRAERRDA
mgnify:CR=1 FL=1